MHGNTIVMVLIEYKGDMSIMDALKLYVISESFRQIMKTFQHKTIEKYRQAKANALIKSYKRATESSTRNL